MSRIICGGWWPVDNQNTATRSPVEPTTGFRPSEVIDWSDVPSSDDDEDNDDTDAPSPSNETPEVVSTRNELTSTPESAQPLPQGFQPQEVFNWGGIDDSSDDDNTNGGVALPEPISPHLSISTIERERDEAYYQLRIHLNDRDPSRVCPPTEHIITEEEANNDVCLICHDPYVAGSTATKLPCAGGAHHYFHTECIDRWIVQQGRQDCPLRCVQQLLTEVDVPAPPADEIRTWNDLLNSRWAHGMLASRWVH